MRWPVGIALAASAIVCVFDGGPISGDVVLLQTSPEIRAQFYAGMSGTAGAVLGFFVAAIAILASLDPKRKIVAEMRQGESMTLLLVNLLTGCLWILVLAGMSIAGWLMPALGRGPTFAWTYQVLGVWAFLEFLVGGFFFAVVTVKVARHE
jgi:hypothetical protein